MTIEILNIEPCELDESHEALRAQIRAFIQETLPEAQSTPLDRAKSWTAYDRKFSEKLGAAGWIGVNWPEQYGARGLTPLHRYVVIEELLAAGAPVQAHWIAERQSATLLMRYADPELAQEIIPRIVAGSCTFAIGMSEPNSGSDLASIETTARRDGDEWVLNGRKVWTTSAHEADYLIALVRSRPKSESRHEGLSQFLIPANTPGVSVQPIVDMLGETHFNEVLLEDVRLPAKYLIGQEGDGWKQVTEELGYERSGPERYLSSTEMLKGALDCADSSNERETVALGELVARYAALRQMSLGVAGMLSRDENPGVAAALVKEAGANLEQDIPQVIHDLNADRDDLDPAFAEMCRYVTQTSVSFSLRGGTREILRGIVSRGLGLK